MFSAYRLLGYITFSNFLIKYSNSRDFLYYIKDYTQKVRKHPYSYTTPRFWKPAFPDQDYDAFLVLDFEASLARVFTTVTEQEIIEFPCAWVDGKTFKIVSVFHRYVRPVKFHVLDPLCTELTGITDDMLAKEEPFPEVLKHFEEWYDGLKEYTNSTKTVFITFGNWDLKKMMPMQCRLSQVKMPRYMRHWIDIRTSFTEEMGRFPKSLKEMVIISGVKRMGRYHSGIDDTVNTASILKFLAQRGHTFHK